MRASSLRQPWRAQVSARCRWSWQERRRARDLLCIRRGPSVAAFDGLRQEREGRFVARTDQRTRGIRAAAEAGHAERVTESMSRTAFADQGGASRRHRLCRGAASQGLSRVGDSAGRNQGRAQAFGPVAGAVCKSLQLQREVPPEVGIRRVPAVGRGARVSAGHRPRTPGHDTGVGHGAPGTTHRAQTSQGGTQCQPSPAQGTVGSRPVADNATGHRPKPGPE